MNGEAIYNTRPWDVFGEGPTHVKGGAFGEGDTGDMTAADIRFTRSKDGKTVYAITLGRPEREVVIHSMRIDAASPKAGVRLLGYAKPLDYHLNAAKQPVITLPDHTGMTRPTEYGYTLKFTGFSVSAQSGP